MPSLRFLRGVNRTLVGHGDSSTRDGAPTGESSPRQPPRSRHHRKHSLCALEQFTVRTERILQIPPQKHTGSSDRPPLLPKGHRALPNRTCRRPEVLRARSSSSGLPVPGSGSKTRERSPARVPPCCWLVSGRDLAAHFRPLSGTTREDTSPVGVIRTAFQRRPEAWRRRPCPRRPRPPPWPEGSSVPGRCSRC